MAAQLPPSLDPSTIPVGTPPSGTQSNFVDPYSAVPIATAVITILVILQIAFVSTRLYGNWKIFHKWALDDCERRPFAKTLLWTLYDFRGRQIVHS